MNLARYLTGCLNALKGEERWRENFDLSRQGFQQSFMALILSVPAYYVIALGIIRERALRSEGTEAALSVPVFAIITLLYLISFSACAYMIAMIFDRQDRFRPWVIARHWTAFFMVFFVACVFGLYLLEIMPFVIANSIAFIVFMATLVMDIRLATNIVGFRWQGGVWTGCAVFASGLAMVIIGMMQVSA